MGPPSILTHFYRFVRAKQQSILISFFVCAAVLFAYSGWAFVEIYPSSHPSQDDSYFLHYQHPNTFESEIYEKRGTTSDHPVCYFSAGYSAGWCSEAFDVPVHAREMTCTARGDEHCEFIMAPSKKLDGYASEYYKK